MSEAAPRVIPRATYRLQFNKDFGFARAAALAPYLARLGVSHVYASPYFKARPGSMHGYDTVDQNTLNPELGSEDDFRAMCGAFRQHGLGQILDFVPNHMGIGGADNPFWLSVLEWGPDSRFADWFDIEWEPDRRYLHQKVLVPFLGDQYGAVLESGGLVLKFDPQEGSLAVWAYDTHKLPICPLDYRDILGDEHPALERLGDSFAHLSASRRDVEKRAAELKSQLAEQAKDGGIGNAVEKAVARFSGVAGDLATWTRLDALIARQYWRPAYFRVAADDINYRRFFNVNDLAGIRMENPEVFARIHQLLFKLVEGGVLDGIRLDHIDGLLNPKVYCQRLRAATPRPVYLLVEKILAPHETLREDWEVDGTTGYEVANLLTGLLVDPAGEAPLTRTYADFTGEAPSFEDIVRSSKLQIMEDEMASELHVLAREAARVARSHPRSADFTSNVLMRALRGIIACFPVYRTYVDQDGAVESDRRDIDWAVAKARRLDPMLDPSVFDFLHRLLTLDLVAQPRSGFSVAAVARVAMRVQQYSGPVMAKGLEDTAFYRYNRLLALNEVGGTPDRFGASIQQFHAANTQRARRYPHAMLTTSTHDTKRGEDARARLAILSELAEEWAALVPLWSRILRAPHASNTEAMPPDADTEYVFYQLLVAAFPPELLEAGDADALSEFSKRMEAVIVKCVREAKLITTWAAPDSAYEEAVLAFVRYALDGTRTNAFLESFTPFAAKISRLGLWNTLVQTVLKLTIPGVPDIYQGAELLDLNLVDPDNRRPIDFDRRERSLGEIEGKTGPAKPVPISEESKLRIVRLMLQLRRRHPALFADGSYETLNVEGPDADRIVAFMRVAGGERLIAAVLRFPVRGQLSTETTTAITLPEGSGVWTDLLADRRCVTTNGSLAAAGLFAKFPVAVLLEQV